MIRVEFELDPEGPQVTSEAAIDICIHTLKREGVTDANVTLIFGSDELLSDLKKTFFQRDHLTDVIAFRLNDYAEELVEGEIYVSLPRAIENADELNEDMDREVGRLIIHGSLHLLDHSDDSEEDKAAMRNLEDKYLSEINWKELQTT